jgi:hypothetical protein
MSMKAILALCATLCVGQAAQAQFGCETNNGFITITNYTGAGGNLNIPAYINGLPVNSIGANAFASTGLTSVTIPDGITSIGPEAFYSCPSLTNAIIGNGVVSMGTEVFQYCDSLTNVHFWGDSPALNGAVFGGNNTATVYYLPGTTGWGLLFAARPTAIWSLPNPVVLTCGPSFGIQTNSFGFIISWATNASVVVEACTNLASPVWLPLATNTLNGGTSYFSELLQTNSPRRFYRVISP